MRTIIAQIITGTKTTETVDTLSVYGANIFTWFADPSQVWLPIICSSVYTIVKVYAMIVKIKGQRILNKQFENGDMDNKVIRKLRKKLESLKP